MKTKENKNTNVENDLGLIDIESVSIKLRKSVKDISTEEARYLTDAKEQIQEFRLKTESQLRAVSNRSDNPNVFNNNFLRWYYNSLMQLENELIKALNVYTKNTKLGRYIRSIKGIGPVLCAELMSHFDISKATYAGQFWSYAGLNDNNIQWLGTEKATKIVNECMGKSKKLTHDHLIEISKKSGRSYDKLLKICTNEKGTLSKTNLIANLSKIPYNKNLKHICWKVGEQFAKLKNNSGSLYAKLLYERKGYETIKNDNGEYKEYADYMLSKYNYGKDTIAYKSLSQGKLPDAQILARAKRYAVKMFISHLFEAMYYFEYGTMAPNPYILSYSGHTDYIKPEVDYITFEQ